MTSFMEWLESRVVGFVAGASYAQVERWTEPRWTVGDMPFDRRTQFLLRLSRPAQRSLPSMTPAEAREYYARLSRGLEREPPVIDRTEDIAIPTRGGPRPARLYTPEGFAGARPALVYFHGGGHVIGDLDTHDTLCRRLCSGAGCIVIAVDYRLAPEHPFPAAVEDADDAYRWVCGNADALGIRPDRIAIGGDSAGGNLSAVVSFLARDREADVPYVQLLIYPGVGEPEHPGRQNPEIQSGYVLDAELVRWFDDTYVPDGNFADPLVAPLNLDTHEGLPPAIVITTAFDLLGGEGIEYAEKLRAAGVPVVHQHVTDLPHSFVTMTALPRAREATEEIAEMLGRAFSGA